MSLVGFEIIISIWEGGEGLRREDLPNIIGIHDAADEKQRVRKGVLLFGRRGRDLESFVEVFWKAAHADRIKDRRWGCNPFQIPMPQISCES